MTKVQRNNKEDQRYQPEQSTMSFSPSDRSSSGPRSTSRGGEDNMVLMDPMSNNTTEVPLTLDLLQSNSHTSSTPRRSCRDTEVLEAIGQALNEYSRSATGSKDLS